MTNDEQEIAQISFFLSKEGVSTNTVFKSDETPEEKKGYQVSEFEYDHERFMFIYFVSEGKKHNPSWLEFINPQLSSKIEFKADTRNPNGILIRQFENRVMLAVFGRASVGLIDMKQIEPDFGIRTAMNMCGNSEIRQTKTQSNTITTTHIDRQVSLPSDSFVFGLNEAEDLRYISAHMRGDPGITLQGKDRLTYKGLKSKRLNWQKLIEISRDFVVSYGKQDYKELFPNYRNFSPATEDEIEILDEILVKSIKANDFENLELTVPEFISDDEFGFAYGKRKKVNVYSFLDVDQISEEFSPTNISAKSLRSKIIYAFSYELDKILSYKKWPFYDCIVYEAEIAGSYFVLSSGRWERIENEFHEKILKSSALVKVAPCPENCKNIDIYDEALNQNREDKFIQEACKANPNWIKFDQAKLKISVGRKDKEFCDILAKFDEDYVDIVHCKPKSGTSSLNYLFSQAKFYGDAFLQDGVFLDDIRKHIEASKSPIKQTYFAKIKPKIENIYGETFRIRLWILYDHKEAEPSIGDLPIMAQFELMLTYNHLRCVSKFSDVIVSFIPVSKVNIKTEKKWK